ncbi:MAG: hypothetical protein SGPRY_008249 [Prymnesium sp.]
MVGVITDLLPLPELPEECTQTYPEPVCNLMRQVSRLAIELVGFALRANGLISTEFWMSSRSIKLLESIAASSALLAQHCVR